MKKTSKTSLLGFKERVHNMKKSYQTAFFGLLSIILIMLSIAITWILVPTIDSSVLWDRMTLQFFQVIIGLIFIPIMLWSSYGAYRESKREVVHRAWWCEFKTSSKEQVTPAYHYGLSLSTHLVFFGFAILNEINFAKSPISFLDILILFLWACSLISVIVGILVYKETEVHSSLKEQGTITKVCRKCGQKYAKEFRFCENCGEALILDTTTLPSNPIINDRQVFLTLSLILRDKIIR